ncbi:hypothetical protein BDR04DRAFT_1110972, partial [Suillus decipiens]
MPIRQSTQHLPRTDPLIAQAKPTPKAGRKADKKKRKPQQKEKTEKDDQVIQKKEVGKKAADHRRRRVTRSAAKHHTHTGVDTSQTIGSAGDHKTRGFPSRADGLGSVSSCALLLPNSIVTSSGGRDIDRRDQRANIPISSAWSKPLCINEAPQPSRANVVAMMPIRQSTQHLRRTDPPIAQAKPTPKAGKNGGRNADKNGGKNGGKNADKKKRKLFYKGGEEGDKRTSVLGGEGGGGCAPIKYCEGNLDKGGRKKGS